MGVTAHRDLLDDELPEIERRVAAFFESLSREFPDLPLRLLTPLAEGGDRLAARVAVSMNIPVIAVLPMAKAAYEEDFSSAESLAEFNELLSHAERIVELPQMSGERTFRALQYAQAGVFVSNHCQVLLAIWDGAHTGDLGGTSDVVRYHQTAVMEGLGPDPTPANPLAENENDLVYHIQCTRHRHVGEHRQPVHARWINTEGESETMPGQYRTMFRRMQRFVRDWREKPGPVESLGSSLAGGPGGRKSLPGDLPEGARLADLLFRAADGLAIHYQKRVHLSLRSIYLLAALMGLTFLFYTEFDGPRILVLVFLGLFLAGVAVHLLGDHRQWHRKYLDYRALAEGLRVQFYWSLSGVVDSASSDFAYDNFLQSQDPELGWIRHVMRHASLARRRAEQPGPEWVEWVIHEWIGNGTEAAQGQLAWYSRRERVNSRRYRRTNLLGSLTLWAGIAVAVMLFLMGDAENPDSGESFRTWLLVLMGALPLIAGIRDAYSHKKAEKELIKQYGFMKRVFTRASRLLNESRDTEFQRSVLRALGQAALDEGAEWLLMHRERPLEHGRL